MTYGWAILAAVVVIGVLAYFGVFSPSTYVPNQCILSAPFGCNAGVANNATGVILEIRNGGGEAFTNLSVAISGLGCVGSNTSISEIADGGLKTITIPCTPTVNSKFKGDITITYKKEGSNLDLTSSGTIVSKVT